MDITQEKIDDLNSILTIKIKAGDYQARVDKAIKDQAKKAKMPGFRPGMVPPAHIKKMYGKSILLTRSITCFLIRWTNTSPITALTY